VAIHQGSAQGAQMTTGKKRVRKSYRVKYASRELNTPTYLPAHNGLDLLAMASGKLYAQISATVTKEARLLDKLLDSYGIPRDDKDRYRKLALALAREYVKGFSTTDRPTGRPRKWPTSLRDELRAEIAQYRKDHPHRKWTTIRICRELAKRPKWTALDASATALEKQSQMAN
jgi:hypothetical protein